MPYEATDSEKFGVRVASRIAHGIIAAGEKFDASLDCTKAKAQSVKDYTRRLADDGWSELKHKAGQVPVLPLVAGLGAGFCLGWFIRHHTTPHRRFF